MKEGFWIKPISILLGILSWFYVNILSMNPITREYKVKITYLNKDNSKNYIIIPENPEVKIKAKGPRKVFIQTKVENNTFGSVDLMNCHGGKLTLPINVIFPSDSNLELVSKEPAQLEIEVKKLVSKIFDLKVNIIGNVPDGYISREPSISTNSLLVTAPEDIIEKIKECRIDINLEGVRTSISEVRQSNIVYYDNTIENDLKSNYITIHKNNIKIDLTVKEGYPEKEVMLKYELNNNPPEGKKLEHHILTPKTVVISGPAKLLEKIEEVNIEKIELSKISQSSAIKPKVKLPKEIKLTGNPNITLDIKYSDIPVTKTFKDLPLEVIHDEKQYVDCDITTYTVELEGLIDDINSIKLQEMKNIINIKGLASGTHQIPLEIPYGFSHRVTVKSLIPSSVSVTIKMMENVENIKQEELLASETLTIPNEVKIIQENSVASQPSLLGSDSEKIILEKIQ